MFLGLINKGLPLRRQGSILAERNRERGTIYTYYPIYVIHGLLDIIRPYLCGKNPHPISYVSQKKKSAITQFQGWTKQKATDLQRPTEEGNKSQKHSNLMIVRRPISGPGFCSSALFAKVLHHVRCMRATKRFVLRPLINKVFFSQTSPLFGSTGSGCEIFV